MARKTQLDMFTMTLVEVAVTKEDGENGIFILTKHTGAVMLAPVATTVRNGKALMPTINANGEESQLPTKKEVAPPTDEDEVSGRNVDENCDPDDNDDGERSPGERRGLDDDDDYEYGHGESLSSDNDDDDERTSKLTNPITMTSSTLADATMTMAGETDPTKTKVAVSTTPIRTMVSAVATRAWAAVPLSNANAARATTSDDEDAEQAPAG
ncbi:Gag-pol fusion protein [Phytophthora cinnamomi]|uniref:Gag-pol fusion protein n=1 Tax=Phytophthora cinnamomi TaxID=4785 RepID=UPI00355A907B|nr:Gag-pol fusion protein [Phytophthora cinnamomi]